MKKPVDLSTVSRKKINYRSASAADAASNHQVRKPLATVVDGRYTVELELRYRHPCTVGELPAVAAIVSHEGRVVDLILIRGRPKTLGDAMTEARTVMSQRNVEESRTLPQVAQESEPKPDQQHAERIRQVVLTNAGKMLGGMQHANAVPARYRRKEGPLVADAHKASALVDAQGKTCLVIGGFYVYLLKPEETSEFDQADNELVLDLGDGVFVGIVQV